MAYRRKKRVAVTRSTTFMSILLVLGVFVFMHFYQQDLKSDKASELGELEILYTDVGQGDSILLKNPEGEFMLIDTGEADEYKKLEKVLKNEGVEELKYFILTHPHSDHIGNASKIIENYKVGNLFMPNITHTTKTFEKLLDSIEQYDINVTEPVVGSEYIFGGAKFLIISPMKEYKELNDNSIVIHMIYGKNTFMFTGDIQSEAENNIVEFCKTNDLRLSVDILKIPHHGSSTSSTEAFINLTNPTVAVISCGNDNSYNHPNMDIVKRYEDRKIKVLRTDLLGTIKVVSNGVEIRYNYSGETDIGIGSTLP